MIVDRELEQIQSREGFASRPMTFQLDKEVLDFLGEKGYNARYGARFLQRTLRERMLIAMANGVNQYPFPRPILVHIFMRENVPQVEVRPQTSAEIPQNTFGSTFLVPGELASDCRRLIHTISQAHLFTRIMNQLDQMERELRYLKKRKQEASFWQNDAKSKRYMSLLEIKARMAQAIEEIEDIESRFFQMLFDGGKESEQHHHRLDQWIKEFEELKTQLIQLDGDSFSVCSLGIYGTKDSLFELAEVYMHVLSQKEFKYKAYTLWFDSNAKSDEAIYLSKGLKTKEMPENYSLTGDRNGDSWRSQLFLFAGRGRAFKSGSPKDGLRTASLWPFIRGHFPIMKRRRTYTGKSFFPSKTTDVPITPRKG